MIKQSNTITVNGKEHEVDTTNPMQVHLINQIGAIEQKKNNLRLELELLEMAHHGYSTKLEEALMNEDTE